AELLTQAVGDGNDEVLDGYGPRALERVWRSQHFSYWMTTMLHTLPDATEFDVRRQLGELASLVGSTAGSTFLAEGYTGWPARQTPPHASTAPTAATPTRADQATLMLGPE